MQASITETIVETKPASRAPGRPRKPPAPKPAPKRRGRPPNPNAIYKDAEKLKARKHELYESTGFLVHTIRRLAAKHKNDVVVRADDDPADLFELLKPMLIAEQTFERERIESNSRLAVIQRRRTRPAPLI